MSGMSFNALSCLRCKRKKIRCGKKRPICDRCLASNTECVYVERKPRARKTQAKVSLWDILNRLKSIEKDVNSSNNDDITSSGEDIGPEDGAGTKDFQPLGSDGLSVSVQSEIQASIYRMVTEATSSTLQILENTSKTTENSSSSQIAASTLSEALQNIQNFTLKSLVRLPDQVDIPSELAKKWVQNCFHMTSQNIFIGLVDKKLMFVLPEIIDVPYVHVDSAALIVYQCFLVQGARLDDDMPLQNSLQYGQHLYSKCLKMMPAWQSKEGSTQMDFFASVLMTWSSIENFDYHLAWNFHVKACKLALDHGLHQLDASPSKYLHPPSNDEDRNKLRRGFWELVQVDYMFQLHYNKPAAIQIADMKVNLPSLMAASGRDLQQNGPVVEFIVSCRVTFIVKQFFKLLHHNLPHELLKTAVAELCEQIEVIIIEWDVMAWLKNSNGGSGDRFAIWLYGQMIINAYTTIILMERKVASIGNPSYESTPSARSVAAAREILHTICVLEDRVKRSDLGTTNVIAFFPFVAFFTLYYHILYSCSTPQDGSFKNVEEGDMHLMEDIEIAMEHAAKIQEGFTPIASAVVALNKVCSHVLRSNKEASASTSLSSSTQSAQAGVNVDPWLQWGMNMDQAVKKPLECMKAIEENVFGGNRHEEWWSESR